MSKIKRVVKLLILLARRAESKQNKNKESSHESYSWMVQSSDIVQETFV